MMKIIRSQYIMINPAVQPNMKILARPPLRDLKNFFARTQKFFEPRPINYNNPDPLHREIEIQSILQLGNIFEIYSGMI